MRKKERKKERKKRWYYLSSRQGWKLGKNKLRKKQKKKQRNT